MAHGIEGYRLSPQQAALWSLQAEGATVLAAQCALALTGVLDRARLRRAADALAARHEILRTTFGRRPGMRLPIQVVADALAPEWREADAAGAGELERLLREEAARPFDFERGPLARFCLVALAGGEHALLVTLHALCADAGTLKNLTDELARCYEAGARGETPDDEPFQYVQFSEWQHELLEEESGERARAFWQAHAEGGAALSAPFARERAGDGAGARGFAPEVVARDADERLSSALAAAARRAGLTAEAWLQACWRVLLWRLAGEADETKVTLGRVLDGRRFEELEGGLGPFARCVPLGVGLSGATRFVDAARAEEEATREAADWQEYFPPASSPELARAACFEFARWPERVSAGGVSFALLTQRACLERFSVKLSCVQAGESLRWEFLYDPRAVTRETVERAASCFETLAASAAADPLKRLDELELLEEGERRRLLFGLNAAADSGEGAREAATPVHELFAEQAARTPHAPAVVFGDERLTYAELNARANRVAHRLRALGVGADEPVGLCVERSVEMVVGLLAVLKAGGCYVPLDPQLPRERLSFQLAQAGARVLLAHEQLSERLPESDCRVVYLDRHGASFQSEPDTNPPAHATPDNLAYVIYTSGSTGRPKGVAVSHRNLSNYTRAVARRLRAGAEGRGPAYATVSTISADLGNTSVFPSLVSGGCLHVVGYDVATDGRLFADYITRHAIDVLKVVPSHFSALLAAGGAGVVPRLCLVFGGEALSFELVARVREAAPSCRVVNHYGPTETTVGSLTFEVEGDPARGPRSSTVPIGRPLDATQVYVLDRARRPVPVGTPGELYIGGRGVARGYVGQPAQTAERFVPHPFTDEPGARLYKTGDLVRLLEDGSVEFLGRVDRQAKIHGFRIEPGEVEAVLLSHAAVRDCVCVVREDEPGHKRLVAYVVARRRDAAPGVSEFWEHSRGKLPEYMIPSAFVTLDALPLTPNGKVDLRALPAPGEERPALERAFLAPRNAVEQTLAEIWGQVLGVRQVGVEDNFFELGGDSIMSLQIVAKCNRAGLHLTPKQLFENPTVERLAAVAVAASGTRAEQGEVSGGVPLTPIQRWFFSLDVPRRHFWNMAYLFVSRRPLEADLLSQAVASLLRHHDALRLRFRYDEPSGGWVQAHSEADDTRVPLSVVDLSPLPAGAHASAVEQVAQQLQSGLNLADGPLLRVGLIRLGLGQPERLLIAVHHLVMDGVSWRVLLEDLQTAYEQLSHGEEVRLPAKTTSFKRWAEQLTEHARSGELRSESPYWLGVKRAAEQAARLPVDFEGGENTEASARSVVVSLTEVETRGLLTGVPAAYGAQIHEALLAALARGYARWAGGRSLAVEVEGHGREDIGGGLDVTRTVGWFTTHYPVVLEADEGSDDGELLKRVKERMRGVPRRGIGWGLLKWMGEGAGAEELRRARPAEVSFNYLGQFDQVVSDSLPFALAPESTGPVHHPSGMRTHLLRVNASLVGGRLQVSISYSENVHRRATVETLAGGFVEALRAIVEHCRSPEAGGFTPSDFPHADISQSDLDKLLARVSSTGEREAAK